MNKSLNKDKNDRIVVAEMFMAKADKYRCFFGVIKRWKDDKGTLYVASKIVMPDGFIWAQATDQKTLGSNLDQICMLRLDHNIHIETEKTAKIFGELFFLN